MDGRSEQAPYINLRRSRRDGDAHTERVLRYKKNGTEATEASDVSRTHSGSGDASLAYVKNKANGPEDIIVTEMIQELLDGSPLRDYGLL